jgi:hypothetical protein
MKIIENSNSYNNKKWWILIKNATAVYWSWIVKNGKQATTKKEEEHGWMFSHKIFSRYFFIKKKQKKERKWSKRNNGKTKAHKNENMSMGNNLFENFHRLCCFSFLSHFARVFIHSKLHDFRWLNNQTVAHWNTLTHKK